MIFRLLQLTFGLIFALMLLMDESFSKDLSPCGSKVDCVDCIQESGCVWCLNPKQEDYTSRNLSRPSHCISIHSANTHCSKGGLIEMKEGMNITQDKALRSKSGKIVQIKPQKVDLRLRVGKPVQIEFQFSQAENYPVDLYYIIDNSFSMKVHKSALAKLGVELSKTMTKLTNDFRIGFGSFIDKNLHPFVSQSTVSKNNPCKGCVRAYGFKNHLPLTSDYNKFSKSVESATLSGNLDLPEGGFDAIMQAIVCKAQIGWRPQARHIIIFSTDAEFHIAGDGKLLGVIEPNDAKCYMKNNQYDGKEKDYPSIAQLSQVIKENNVNLIFAIVQSRRKVLSLYKELSRNIGNSKADGLNADSKNVVKLVEENYKAIVGSVTMETNRTNNIEVKVTPHCRQPMSNGCAGVRLGEIVNFTASITLLECARNSTSPTYISIKPNSLAESLIIKIDPICQCQCELPSHPSYERKSKKCKEKGDLVCGLCQCDKGFEGAECECDSAISHVINGTVCREKPSSPICSGRGQCKCGLCTCDKIPGVEVKGKFCQCDNTTCEMERGEVCNGKGRCDCDKCICDDGWTGSSCGCRNITEPCIRGGETAVCSGRGACDCGKCVCSGNFTGTFCQVCPSCDGECEKLKDCVQCTVFGTVIKDKSKCQRDCIAYIINSTKSDIVKDDEQKICRIYDENKCEITFKYMYDEHKQLVVVVQEIKKCPLNLLIWAAAIVAFVLFIGILTLLIWKLATGLHDKREYLKFLKEQQSSKWHSDGNPLYKGATTTFQNPHYTEE